jgi:glycosyltransferase involved in cell wall biosynthesis
MDKKISIIIPALNESRIIVQNIDEIVSYLNGINEFDYEILVVDDGSTDGMTQLLLDALVSRPYLKLLRHEKNLGRGRGIRTGFENASGDYIVCLDADLSYDPKHIRLLVLPLINDEADITLASPYHKQGIVKNVPKQRAWISKWGNKVLSKGLGLNVSTVTCIVRGFKRNVIQTLELVNNGKELHLEILHKAKLYNFRVQEVPAALVWRDKKRGHANKILPELAIFKMRKTILSHLVFNYVSNPGLMLSIPIIILILIIVFGVGTITAAFFDNLSNMNLGFYQTLRLTMLNGQLSLFMVLFSLIFLMLFLAFYFISLQMKYYFNELYILLARIKNNILD